MSCQIDGTNDVQSTTTRRARKEHRCCACAETIRPRDVYEYTFILYEGEPTTYKRCLRCAKIWDTLAAEDRERDDGVAWALNCGHDWEETHDGPPPDDIARLAFLTRDEIQRELAPTEEPKR